MANGTRAVAAAVGGLALLLAACQTVDRNAELRQKRDAAQARLAQASAAEEDDATFLVSADRTLGERPHSLEFYDTLSPDNPARVFLARQLVREFVLLRRYADAVLGWDGRSVNRLFNAAKGGAAAAVLNPGGDHGHRHLLLQMADYFEALAGTGDLPDAQELAARICDFDHSSETLVLLKERAARAEHPELPATRNRQGVLSVVKPVSKLTEFKRDLENPALRDGIVARAKRQLDSYYGYLFEEFNLPPDRLDQFKDMLVRRQLAVFDASTAARKRGEEPQNDPEALHSLAIREAAQKMDAEIAVLLRPERYLRYADYNTKFSRWYTAGQLGAVLRATATPLTLPQAAQLVEAYTFSTPADVISVSLNIEGGSGLFPGPYPSRPDADVWAKAAGFLSPPQLRAWHQLEQRQEIDWDFTDRVEPEDPALVR
jgi:hypothetical protein